MGRHRWDTRKNLDQIVGLLIEFRPSTQDLFCTITLYVHTYIYIKQLPSSQHARAPRLNLYYDSNTTQKGTQFHCVGTATETQ